MILEIKFTKGSKSYSSPLNEKINGFINSCLGKNNEYHGHFSNYSVSSLQGAVINESENTKSYVNGAYLYISSPHSEFLGKIIANLMPMVNNRGIDDMMVDSFEIKDFPVHYEYDLVRTIDPIMLHGTNDKIYTFKDEDFIEKLTENSKQKLIKEGIPENVANTIKIYPFHFENAKVKTIKIKGTPNISSKAMFRIYGNKEARHMLYDMGLGKSTGMCFGAVSLNKENF